MTTPSATLYRSSKDRMVGGVISAFAERLVTQMYARRGAHRFERYRYL